MHPVVMLSTQYLSQDDLRALSTYLLGDAPLHADAVAPGSADAAQLAPAGRAYLAVCAGCHGREGEGKPHVAVPMQGNLDAAQADPHNLIVAMLDGVDATASPGTESMQAMPGFAATLSDDELAHLANYLRATWGGQAANVSAADVGSLR